MTVQPWYRSAYQRSVIDMHIPDWDASFLAKFNPHDYVANLKRAHFQSAVVYAHSHTGLFNYPTRVGAQHRSLNGRDIFGEMLSLCHANDIKVVAYCSLIFDCWSYQQHPGWRILMADGIPAGERARYGVVCPNAPEYRRYVTAFVEELITRYDVDGIRFDMTFWPAVCYCTHCRKRFAQEIGGELPTIVNWEDPLWVSFQRKREAWLVEFAALVTGVVRRCRPDISVEHQSSTYHMNWLLGVTTPLAEHSDFLQGDFSGEAVHFSFVRKLLYNLTPNRPSGFETGVCATLAYHTAYKPVEVLNASAHSAIADGAAMIFIDAIDPAGTLNPVVYDRIAGVQKQTMRYDRYRGGDLQQDVGIYFSTASKFDPSDNGRPVMDFNLSGDTPQSFPHIESLLHACQALIQGHIPFGVITRRNLADLQRHRLVILPDVLVMDDDEEDALRRFVADGGCLYASKRTSLFRPDGPRRKDFLLAELFGAHYCGETQERYTYVAPVNSSQDLFPGFSQRYPLGLEASQVRLQTDPGAQVLATLTLPYTDPSDFTRFASIHSNPPGIATADPAIVSHPYGKGRVIYSAGELERWELSRQVFLQLVHSFQIPFSFAADAPGCVEVTLFDQPEQDRWIVNLLNFQSSLPNLPVLDIKVRLRIGNITPKQVLLLPEEKPLPFTIHTPYLEFCLERLETFAMVAVERT